MRVALFQDHTRLECGVRPCFISKLKNTEFKIRIRERELSNRFFEELFHEIPISIIICRSIYINEQVEPNQ